MGYLVSYNHPQWSMETGDNYNRYEGVLCHGKCANYGCTADGRQDSDNILVYEELLRHGKRLGVLATDDNHNRHPFGHPNCDSFGGFTMVAAPELTYEAVFRALQKGDYYASGGPKSKRYGSKTAVSTSRARRAKRSFGLRQPPGRPGGTGQRPGADGAPVSRWKKTDGYGAFGN